MKVNSLKKAIKKFIYFHLEFDRMGERKIKKSIEIWHKGGSFNRFRAHLMWNHIRKKYSSNYYPGITVGSNLRIEHCMWTQIGKTTILGDNVRIYDHVDVIAKVVGDQERLDKKERRHAKIGNNVILGSGCTIIGPVTIGDNCIIGARAIVTHDIPPDSVVIGINNISTRRPDQNAPSFESDVKNSLMFHKE